MAKENHPKKLAPKSDTIHGCKNLLRNLDRHHLLELLSQGFCHNCETHLEKRVRTFLHTTEKACDDGAKGCEDASWSSENSERTDLQEISPQNSIRTPEPINSQRKKEYTGSSLTTSLNNKRYSLGREFSLVDAGLSEEEENKRISEMGHKDDFCCLERIDGRPTNVLEGLELRTRVFNSEEQRRIVEFVYKLQDMGKKRLLRGRTYSEPRKWMRGKGRATIQFGCCYNYAEDKDGNPPGINRNAEVEPLPALFKQMIKRLVRWHVLPATCIPDSCIVNIYDEGDCIPPHIDHHDFARPFCTVSLLSETNILFGSNLMVVGAGEFEGPTSIRLPIGSVLMFNGNGADIAKHCISAVQEKRVSITFRKMDDRKRPYNFEPDPEMRSIKPLVSHHFHQRRYNSGKYSTANKYSKTVRTRKRFYNDEFFLVEKNDFPPFRRLRVHVN